MRMNKLVKIYIPVDALHILTVWQNRTPPLWSSGQSSWLQIRRPGFDSWHY
jgi:hypothetical protein